VFLGVLGWRDWPVNKPMRVRWRACSGTRQRDLPDRERAAIANYMIALWARFRDENVVTNLPSQTVEIQAGRDALVKEYLNMEGDIADLCRAVKVVSSVVADQLAHPLDGAAVTSDYGLEVQAFRVDASMLRFAVDHAAELALAVSCKMR
jgi:hypothetical protein